MDVQKNLNRSFSESDINSDSPYFRRVVVEEFYRPQYGSSPLIRYHSQLIENEHQTSFQVNCQISNYRSKCFSKINLGKEFNTNALTQSCSDKNLSDHSKTISASLPHESNRIDKNTCKSNLMFESFQRPETPMETDESDDEINNDSYSTEATFGVSSNQTKVARKLNQKPLITKPKSGKFGFSDLIIFSVIVLLLACFSIFFHEVQPQEEKPEQPEKAYFRLNKVLYQDHVKEITLNNLNTLHEDNKFKKVLVFVGSTGVGKTFTVNLIRTQFPVKYVVDINFLLGTHLNTENIIASLRSDGCYFLTIDDLTINNLQDVISFISQLPETCMLIVPIFNIHDVDDNLVYTINYDHLKKIKQEFMKAIPSNLDIVLFNTINRDNLETWLRDQMIEKNVFGEEEIITSLLDGHDAHIYGFKGLPAKMNALD